MQPGAYVNSRSPEVVTAKYREGGKIKGEDRGKPWASGST